MDKISREKFQKLKALPFFKGRIASDSMSPLIKTGDLIIVDVGQDELKRFDIVVFFQEGLLICHYLWRLNQKVSPVYLQTRSLSGNLDFPVPWENYLGKVVSHKIGLGRKIWTLLRMIR